MKNKTKLYDAIRALKKELNALGAKLTVEGDIGKAFGPKTLAALENALVKKDFKSPAKGEFFGAPWMGMNNDLLGSDERDLELNARYVPGWKISGLPGYKTLIGSRHAWCIMRTNYDLHLVGIKGTGRAGAYTLSSWGKKCPFWFGAQLDIKHKGGGRHAAEFLYWIDEGKKIAATRDGNRSNKFAVFQTDLSGRGDTLPGGPRWPDKFPDGQLASKAEVLKAYPYFKVGGTGNSTR